MAYLLTTLSLVLSILLSALIIPRILVVAYRKKLFDIPNERKVHDEIIPRLGGISFVPTILFSLSFVTGLRYLIGFEIAENRLHFIIPEFFFLICGLTRDLWGSYTQIRGGLTVDDYVAFPYGRDVKPGAATVEATADQLYSGM